MSDDSMSERLAPVSYLPWAAPIADSDDELDPVDVQAELSTDLADAERAVRSMERLLGFPNSDVVDEPSSRSSSHGEGRRGGGSDRARGGLRAVEGDAPASRSAGRDRGPRGSAGGSRGGRLHAVGADGVGAAEAEVSETGAERDARIDRLVVSRLRRSSLSVAEVRDVLAEHGLDDIEIDEWIDRYERLGYLDDVRLAEQLVHVQVTRRGRGSAAILSELTRRGVDAGVAQAAVETLGDDAEREQALAVASRRARQLTGLDRATAERRLSAFLQRRGFSASLVREAVTEALSGERS